jgi:hypothetical protein
MEEMQKEHKGRARFDAIFRIGVCVLCVWIGSGSLRLMLIYRRKIELVFAVPARQAVVEPRRQYVH